MNLLPPDIAIAECLGLELFYHRVYRPASDAAHLSVGSMLDGFIELPGADSHGKVSLELPQPDGAQEALELAAITYGAFLERAEPVVHHGVADEVKRLLSEYFAGT